MGINDVVDDILAHHGVKGMHWGVRRSRGQLESSVSTTHIPGKKKVTASGGHGLPAHEDAIKAAVAKQKAKSSGVNALSNHELKQLNERLNLEQNFSRLTSGNTNVGRKFVEQQLKQIGTQHLSTLLTKGAKKALGA